MKIKIISLMIILLLVSTTTAELLDCKCDCNQPIEKKEPQTAELKDSLQVALIVLVVLLVIFGLIIGFSRLNKKDNEDDEETYY